jgi:hypothetical protein
VTGEAKVTEYGGSQGVVTMPSTLTGTLLTLRYRPQLLVYLSGLAWDYASENRLQVQCSVEEHLAGTYTGA